jgi:hypothetical protein
MKMEKIFLLIVVSSLYITSCVNSTLDGNMINGSDGCLSCEQLLDTTGLDLYAFIPFTGEEMKTMDYPAKLERRQIPGDMLQKMSTKALFYQFALCELSRGMYVHNSAQAGFRAVSEQLNMLRQLLNRPDAGPVLLELLQGFDPSAIEGDDCFHLYECLQRTIAQTEIIATMTKSDISRYIQLEQRHQEAIKSLSGKNRLWSYPESLAAIAYGLGNVMLESGYEPFRALLNANRGISGLMEGGNLKDEQIVLLINNYISGFNK